MIQAASLRYAPGSSPDSGPGGVQGRAPDWAPRMDTKWRRILPVGGPSGLLDATYRSCQNAAYFAYARPPSASLPSTSAASPTWSRATSPSTGSEISPAGSPPWPTSPSSRRSGSATSGRSWPRPSGRRRRPTTGRRSITGTRGSGRSGSGAGRGSASSRGGRSR